jgi:osmotically-inducible protein OsmY
MANTANDNTDDAANTTPNVGASDDLARRIAHRLRTQMHFDGTVAVGANGAVYLSGRVPSDRNRQQAQLVARELSGGAPVENNLDVERILPDDRDAFAAQDLVQEDQAESVIGTIGPEGELNPLFTGQPLETNDLNVIGADTVDDDPDAEPDPTFFAPTDPVVTAGPEGELEVLGGFDPTATASQDVAPSFADNQPGDEALVTAIQRELREDATTTTLPIEIAVVNGVARLRGQVPDLIDAENAEAVAGRVPGVRDVIDELDVLQMDQP